MMRNKQKPQKRNKNKDRSHNGNTNGNGRKFRPLGLFIKTFLISTAVFTLLVFSGGMFFLNKWIKPPVVETSAQSPESEGYYEDGEWHEIDAASIPTIGDKADEKVGSILHGTPGYTTEDRKKDFYTFVIFGVDEFYNTDTIMLASYDGVNNTANVIGIPRDSLVNVKRNAKKINVAYGAGTNNGGGHEGGVEQLKRELSTIVGFMPDFYVMINLKTFVKIIDTVGGIDVYNNYNMDYDDPWQDLHIHINKGQQHLNGNDALRFARYRRSNDEAHSITDYQRIENQQAVIQAVLTKLLRPENLLKTSEFVQIFNDNVRSDLDMSHMLWFAKQLNEVRGADALSVYTMPTCGTSGPGSWYEFLDKDAILELVNNTINPYVKDINASAVDIIAAVP
jgi:LCP family protein required for cell wall assembly